MPRAAGQRSTQRAARSGSAQPRRRELGAALLRAKKARTKDELTG
jgi:hypothetical protein